MKTMMKLDIPIGECYSFQAVKTLKELWEKFLKILGEGDVSTWFSFSF